MRGLALLAAILALVTACGGGEGASTAVDPASAAPTADVADADAEGTAAAAPSSTLTEGTDGGERLTTGPEATATPVRPRPTATPTRPRPSTTASPAPVATAVPEPGASAPSTDACAVLGLALVQTVGPAEDLTGGAADCFVLAEEPIALFVYPADEFDAQAAESRDTPGTPIEGLGDRAIVYDGRSTGVNDGFLVQTGMHTFFLSFGGPDRETALAVAAAVADALH